MKSDEGHLAVPLEHAARVQAPASDDKARFRADKKRADKHRKADGKTCVTCPASRHAQMIAEYVGARKPYPMLQEEPEHCAGSILSAVGSLYEARLLLAQNKCLTDREVQALRTAADFLSRDMDSIPTFDADIVAITVRSIAEKHGAAVAAPAQAQDEREAFKREWIRYAGHLPKRSGDGYAHGPIDLTWRFWKAAWAAATQAVSPPDEEQSVWGVTLTELRAAVHVFTAPEFAIYRAALLRLIDSAIERELRDRGGSTVSEGAADNELPGMWQRSDFEGGQDEVRGPDWKRPAGVEEPKNA